MGVSPKVYTANQCVPSAIVCPPALYAETVIEPVAQPDVIPSTEAIILSEVPSIVNSSVVTQPLASLITYV